MSRFGWAYISSESTGAVAGGPTNSVQFNSGSQVLTGSSNFTFNPATNTLVVTGTISASVYQGITVTATPAGSDKQIQYNSGSALGASSNFTFDYSTNTLYLTGTLRADNLIVSSSQILKSGSTIFGDDASDTHQFTGSILGGIVSGTTAQFTTITGSTVTGSVALFTSVTGNLLGTASNATLAATASYYNTSSLLITASVTDATITLTKGDATTFPLTINNVVNAQTASYVLNAVSASYASNADLLDNRDSTTFAGTGSNTYNGNQVITGTLDVSSTLSGTTAQFTTVTGSTITGSTGLFTTITASQGFVSGGLSVGNYIQMLPVGNVSIPTNQTASYIYTSGSTNDLYFTQYQPGTSFTNTTRLRWVEGGLSSGLLHGGILSTVTGTTSFNLTSGSGIIVAFNATTGSDPYPTIQYVTWGNFVSQSLIYSASSPITYIAIDNYGAISQTNVAFTQEQFKDRIVIGRVLHQSGAVTNGTITTPTTAYGISSNTQDFFRAFGPLKVSGQVLASSGSATLAITRTAGDSYVEGRNYSANPNIPNYVSAADDPALTTTKIFYEWVSGSTVNIDTNGGTGYSALIPNKYNLNGTITTITPTNNKFTVQRVYWFPKSVTRAFYVYYGSTIYSSLADAIAAIADETNFTEGDNTKASAVYLGSVVMEAGISNFTDTTKSKVVNGGLFRATSNGGGGGGASATPGGSTHQIQFNDSGVFNGSANLTFDTNVLTLTGSFNMVGTGSLDIDGGYITGSGRASFGIVTGSVITGSTALFTTLTASNITASNQLQVASDAFIGGNIVGSGGFKAAYATYTGSFTAAANSYFIGISTTGSVVTASLNSATNYPAGQTLIFKDIGGNAAVNNIRIKPSGSQTIDGATSLVISSTSGSATLVSNGLDGFYIVGLT